MRMIQESSRVHPLVPLPETIEQAKEHSASVARTLKQSKHSTCVAVMSPRMWEGGRHCLCALRAWGRVVRARGAQGASVG